MEFYINLGDYAYCAEMLLAELIFIWHLKKRQGWVWRFPLTAVILLASNLVVRPIIFEHTIYYTLEWFIFVYLELIAMGLFCLDTNWKDAVFAASLSYALQHFASSLYLLLAYRGFEPRWEGYLYPLAYVPIYIFGYFVIARKMSEDGSYGVSSQRTWLTVFMVLSVTLVLSFSVKKTIMGLTVVADEGISLFRYCQLYSMLLCLALLLSQVIQQREMKAERQLLLEEAMWKDRQKQYELSRENIDLINHKCHDLKHQIAALSREAGKFERREQFADEISKMMDIYDSNINTGNEALDTILMEKALYCKENNILWSCVADAGSLDFVDVIDLYTLLGNALDNAIESVEKIMDQGKRQITVRIYSKNQFVRIQVDNRMMGKIRFRESGLPATSKKDKEQHGMGTESIRQIAEKYQGSASFKVEEDLFRLGVVIPIPTD